jgi:hypothetical protein
VHVTGTTQTVSLAHPPETTFVSLTAPAKVTYTLPTPNASLRGWGYRFIGGVAGLTIAGNLLFNGVDDPSVDVTTAAKMLGSLTYVQCIPIVGGFRWCVWGGSVGSGVTLLAALRAAKKEKG